MIRHVKKLDLSHMVYYDLISVTHTVTSSKTFIHEIGVSIVGDNPQTHHCVQQQINLVCGSMRAVKTHRI